MSLVNDMLRDLDRRKRSPAGSDRAKVVFDCGPGAVSINFMVLALMVMLGLVLGLAAGFYLFSPESDVEADLGEMDLMVQLSPYEVGSETEAGRSALGLAANTEVDASQNMALHRSNSN